MYPTLPYILEKFKQYNALIFQDKLPMLPIRIGHARTSLGGLRYAKRKNLLGKVKYSNFQMVISDYYDLPEREVEDTLIHEMIHYYIAYHQLHDTSAHGELFHQMMNEINEKFGRHITVSHRSEQSAVDRQERIKAHYICVSELTDGRGGVTVSAKTRVFELWRKLPQSFPIKKMTWYGSTDPYFNRFPSALKPKMYLVDRAEIEERVKCAVELVNDGHVIRPKD